MLRKLWNLSQALKVFQERLILRLFYDPYTVAQYWRKKGCQIGENCRILTRYFGSEPYLIKIGNNVAISSCVTFVTHDGAAHFLRDEMPDLHVFGKIEIKDHSGLGKGCVIMPNVTIGPNSMVGAYSVVRRDVPPNMVVAGNPARRICSVEDLKKFLLKKFAALHLKGPRSTWREQLIKHFWGDPGLSTMEAAGKVNLEEMLRETERESFFEHSAI